jgi:photosystem II stability/assembly factor-like uncharacterized protein
MLKFFFVFFFIILSYSGSNAQWTNLDGPRGGLIFCMASSDSSVFAGTEADGFIRRKYSDDSWEEITGWEDVFGNEIFSVAARDSIVCLGALDGFFVSDEDGISNQWQPRFTNDEVWSICLLENQIFVASGYGLSRYGLNSSNGILVDDSGHYWAIGQCGQNVISCSDDGEILVTDISNYSTFQIEVEDQGAGFSSIATKDSIAFASLANGQIFYTYDSGNSWNMLEENLPDTSISVIRFLGTDLFVGLNAGGVYKSTDMGNTWQHSSVGLPNVPVISMTSFGSKLYCGTLIGVFESTDGGAHWSSFNDGMIHQYLNNLVTDGNTLLGSNDEGAVYRYPGMNSEWPLAAIGLDSQNITSLVSMNNSFFAGTPNGVFGTNDQANTWQLYNNGLTNLNITCLVSDGSNLFAGTQDGLFMSFDGGINWFPTFNDISGVIKSLLFTESFVYVSTNAGLYRSADDGLNSFWISDVGATKMIQHGEVLHAIVDGVVISSFDNGGTWANSSEGIEGLVARKLLPVGSAVFVATNVGLYRTYNDGETWSLVQIADCVNCSIQVLTSDENFIYIGTKNGVSRASISSLVGVAENTTISKWHIVPNPMKDIANVVFDGNQGGIQLTISDMTGREIESNMVSGNIHRIERGKLSPGTYLITVSQGGVAKSEKLIVE